MILRETPASFVLINQHDHARAAGLLAAAWHPALFSGPDRRDEVLFAVREHDCGWISLDQEVMWEAGSQRPYSFIDYPLAPKLRQYGQGIAEVAETSAYAALLCSLHYSTFPDLNTTPEGRAFLEQEQSRQQKLRAELALNAPGQKEQLDFHLQLLKCCDGLSIYFCINKPGATKVQEHPWYQGGIPYSDRFAFTRDRPIVASWLDTQTVQVRPFPFTQPFSVTIPYRQVLKTQVLSLGGRLALLESAYQEFTVHLVP